MLIVVSHQFWCKKLWLLTMGLVLIIILSDNADNSYRKVDCTCMTV